MAKKDMKKESKSKAKKNEAAGGKKANEILEGERREKAMMKGKKK